MLDSIFVMCSFLSGSLLRSFFIWVSSLVISSGCSFDICESMYRRLVWLGSWLSIFFFSWSIWGFIRLGCFFDVIASAVVMSFFVIQELLSSFFISFEVCLASFYGFSLAISIYLYVFISPEFLFRLSIVLCVSLLFFSFCISYFLSIFLAICIACSVISTGSRPIYTYSGSLPRPGVS